VSGQGKGFIEIAVRFADPGSSGQQNHHTTHRPLLSSRLHLGGRGPQPVAVAEEQHTLRRALSTLRRLDPLAPPSALPHGLDKANGAIARVSAVVAAHDGLDGFGGLVGIVEGD